MLGLSIWWWCGIALEALLVVRGIIGKLTVRYPVFYAYVSFIAFQDLLRFAIYRWYPDVYRTFYWSTEFLAVIFGCALVFEIYRVGFSAYPGAARVARNILALVFASALVKALADAAADPRWWLEATARDVEVTLRAVQAVFLIALALIFLFYSIPFGKNLRGVLMGYGLFVAVSVVSMIFGVVGVRKFPDFWAYLFPASYFVTLAVWATHLWSYQPAPQPQTQVRLEQDYQSIAAATRRRLQGARGYIAKAVRP